MPQLPYSKIQFHFLVKGFNLRERTRLKKFLTRLMKIEGRQFDSIDFIFCSDEFLLSLNQAFLSHNYYTDILTFDLSESDKLVGEVYISIDRVKANSKEFNKSQREELHRVIFHGVFHLCGYKDKTPKEQKKMRAKEDLAISMFF